MPWYRMYFLSAAGEIRNADSFEADTDAIAISAAEQIHEAVSDIYSGYELCETNRTVCKFDDTGVRQLTPAKYGTSPTRAFLLRRLEIMRESETAFARSARLIDRILELRAGSR